ncbi:trehalase-like domain-containing protein, partial [Nocardiopsis sp. TNDT3]|uniref:trehalase-like domain-containing protein n=1 Tax=Nocardiopsis sp. TNDT3 TaxID=2249354 RepID=UPI00351A23B3
MAPPIEDHALLGGMQTSALDGGDGSVDRLCLPGSGSGARFAALLGDGTRRASARSRGGGDRAPTAAGRQGDGATRRRGDKATEVGAADRAAA